VIIIGDVPASKLGDALCRDIRDAVERTGSGLIMLGGENTFGMGSYDKSPLAEIMPVRMGTTDVRAVEQCRAVPNQEGSSHPVVQIARHALENDAAWKGLPALDSFVRFGETKPAATTLLETETGRAPMLVTQNYGKGNTMVFAPDATWKWAMHSDEAGELYTKLWHNIISWLSQKSDNRKKSVWISLDRFLYFPRETVAPRVNVRNEEGKPVNNAVVELTLTPPGKPAVLCPTAFTANSYSCALSPAAGGEYVLDAKVTVDGKPFGADSTRFIVQVPDVEMDSPFANHNYLATLASVSGGTTAKLEDLPAFLDRMKDAPNFSTFDIPTKRPLWDKVPLIVIFCAALAAEWVLRRRNRLI
jgi:hypothetical protein